jgi:molecular chaperone HscA
MEARKLREQRVEAERVIEALRAALADDGDELLDAAERDRVETSLNRLAETTGSGSYAEIKAAVEALEKSCEFYVERRMNVSVRKAMSGHSVDDFEN